MALIAFGVKEIGATFKDVVEFSMFIVLTKIPIQTLKT
jgi:hypothetical protein